MRSFEKFRRNVSERSSSRLLVFSSDESRRPSIVIDLSRVAFYILPRHLLFVLSQRLSTSLYVDLSRIPYEIELIDNDEGIFSIFKFLSSGRDRENERRVI